MAAWDDLPNAKHIARILKLAQDAARDAAWDAARDALLTLIAWDDCAYLLDLPPDAVRLIAASGNHAAVLLLPTIIALNKEPA